MTDQLDLPKIGFKTQQAWREWLEKNHAQPEGIWLQMYKKDSGVPSITYAEALDEALCFGWIDGQVKKADELSWYQRFTPRRKRSIWSHKNTQNVERLIKLGKMTAAGMAQIEAAKADGRWQAAYLSPSRGRPPDDFMTELRKNEKAYAFFQTLDKHNTYAVYFRLQSAKTPETRENRIKMFIAMFEKEEKFHD